MSHFVTLFEPWLCVTSRRDRRKPFWRRGLRKWSIINCLLRSEKCDMAALMVEEQTNRLDCLEWQTEFDGD
jgi:hypothetical protein